MLKYLSKFAMDILPSVAATIIGAYIVNHYIVTKPAADAPVAAAVSRAEPEEGRRESRRQAGRSIRRAATSRSRGSRRRVSPKRPSLRRPPPKGRRSLEKPQEKSGQPRKPADKPVETASIPAETRRHQPRPREKAVAKSAPVPVSPPMPAAVAPVVAAPNTAPPAEARRPSNEHRDANDLARAAIERLRGTGDGSPRPRKPPASPDAPRVASAPTVAAPVVVAADGPAASAADHGLHARGRDVRFSAPGSSQRVPASRGPTIRAVRSPPADIPEAARRPLRPLDLRAEAVGSAARREHTTVAEDMLLAAKSVFHAVLPK